MEQYALVGVIQNNMPGSEKQNSMFNNIVNKLKKTTHIVKY